MRNKIYLSVWFCMQLLPGAVSAQQFVSVAKNSVTTTVPKVKISDTLSLNANNSLTAIQYTDGLGMSNMTVAVDVTPLGADLVTLTARDYAGRPLEEWLPVPVNMTGIPNPTNVMQATKTFYGDSKPYTSYNYLDAKSVEITLPGADWHNNNKHSTERFIMVNSSSSYPEHQLNRYVPEGETSVKKTGLRPQSSAYIYEAKDEDDKTTYVYYDEHGQLILKRAMTGKITEKVNAAGNVIYSGYVFHDTYYIYNDLGKLTCVLPPEASARMTANTTYSHAGNNTNNNPVDQYAYLYRYDALGRCIAQKLPGAAWIYFVYDKADRLVLKQTGVQRETGEWSFSKYDRLGRVIQTGTTQTTAAHASLQSACSNMIITESWQTGSGYTNTCSLVGTNTKILTQNYYDSYDFLNRSAYSTIKNDLTYAHTAGFDSVYIRTIESTDISLRGVLTGTSVWLLDQSTELLTAMYYDRNGRVVQSLSNNHMGGYDKYYFGYNFSGSLVKHRHIHKIAGKDAVTENYTYQYDNAGRPTATYHAINNLTSIKISEMQYDEALRVKKKKLHGNMAAVDYTYNIHNRIKSITAPVFSETIRYQNGNTRAFYNGNISEIDETLTGQSMSYRYLYDDLNRLTNVDSYSSVPKRNRIADMFFRYDKNGNITTLKRKGWIVDYNDLNEYGEPVEKVAIVDSLGYTYKGNQLYNVGEVYPTSQPYYSYPPTYEPYPYTNCSFLHDANGNRSGDFHRKIAWIKYNALNLPSKIQAMNGDKTEYVYDASGQKRRMITYSRQNIMQIPMGATGTENTAISSTAATDYCANFYYYRGNLRYIFTPDGYIDASNASASNWQHVYFVKDHLGSVRSELRSATLANPTATTCSQDYVKSYYAFGMDIAMWDDWRGNGTFLYGGKQWANGYDRSLDFHARLLDTELGRFTTPDPLAELNYSTSPYAYCSNNPINRTDPTGMYDLPEVVITPDYPLPSGGKRPDNSFDYRYGGGWYTPSSSTAFFGEPPAVDESEVQQQQEAERARKKLEAELMKSFRQNAVTGLIGDIDNGIEGLESTRVVVMGDPGDGLDVIVELVITHGALSYLKNLIKGAELLNATKTGLPAKVFSTKAPTQVTPGVTKLAGQHIDDLGRVQPWQASYDNFGRLIERTDWNAANSVYNINATHHHIWQYLPKGQVNSINHTPGVGPLTGW